MDTQHLPSVVQIAMVCHEANRAYCASHGDLTQPPWDAAPASQQESVIAGVEAVLANRDMSAEESHGRWCDHKLANGWKLGPVKDVANKEHPNLVPYADLHPQQQLKDHLFRSIVLAMSGGDIVDLNTIPDAPQALVDEITSPNQLAPFERYLEPFDGPVIEGEEKNEIIYAKDQPQYLPLRTLRTSDGQVLSRWGLDESERSAVLAGADIYLVLHTFNQPLQPILMKLGYKVHEDPLMFSEFKGLSLPGPDPALSVEDKQELSALSGSGGMAASPNSDGKVTYQDAVHTEPEPAPQQFTTEDTPSKPIEPPEPEPTPTPEPAPLQVPDPRQFVPTPEDANANVETKDAGSPSQGAEANA